MALSHQQVAAAFSSGKFELTYSSLADDAQWNIIREKILQGKENIIAFCTQTAQYFASVHTVFTVSNIVAADTAVAIDGSAVFTNQAGKQTCVSSCDLYCFAGKKLVQINSYCISTNPK